MSLKDSKKPRPIRYVLSADRKLQKLSLKKMSERAKRTRDAARSSRRRESATAKPSPAKDKHPMPRPWALGSRAIVLGVIGVVAAAALMASGDLSSPPTEATVAQAPAPARPSTPLTPTVSAPTVKPTVKAPAEQKVKARTLAESTPKPATTEPATKPTAADVSAVTITGCLQRDAKTFWLKDASGTDAPKSRSWKSGFLKRSSSRVDVAGAAGMLSNYVGQRVAATGVLVNRELRTQSMRRIASSCD